MKYELLTAKEILVELKKMIATLPCQENYVKTMANIGSYHLKKMKLLEIGLSPDEIPLISALIVAPTGTGKTFIMEKMAKLLKVNFIHIDCSNLAHEGWKGSSLSAQLLAAKEKVNDDEIFANSILFLDEFDKLKFRYEGHDSGNPMENLLSLFNGGTIVAETGNRGESEIIDISKFTIILGGAFEGLDEIIKARKFKGRRMGFSTCEDNEISDMSSAELYHHLEADDLVTFGLISELVGRISSYVFIDPFKLEDYKMLLVSSNGSVQSHYNTYFNALYGAHYKITEKAVCKIAEHCMDSKYGARAVNPFVNKLMVKAFSTVEDDNEINKIILDANDGECFVRFERGERGVPLYAIRESDKPYLLIASNIESLADKICNYYSCEDEETKRLLKAYLDCTLYLLYYDTSPKDFHFDSLRKLARDCLDNDCQILRILIEENLNNTYSPTMSQNFFKKFKEEFKKHNKDELSRALTDVFSEIVKAHSTSNIRFKIANRRRKES